ncbi:MAG TPA: ABC transporter substrate-binding protein [Herpetosiphonaceae bacterium]
MTSRELLPPTDAASNGRRSEAADALSSAENVEWQLSELVDAISAEIDRAEDTLSLKSFARGISFAIKQLSLDLEVTVRRAPDGRVLFRTVDPDQQGMTLLKLDFAQVLQSQLQGLRKPLDQPGDPRDLATLPGITAEQIKRLNAIAIYSVDDLERYTQTAAMIAEVSRKTDIADPQIRIWRHLPFLWALKPASGPPGSTVLIEGGNLGAVPDSGAMVLFAGHAAQIVAWSDVRVTVTMPQVSGRGVLFAIVDGQITNLLAWEATTIDLVVRNLSIGARSVFANEPFLVEADLINQGSISSGPFEVEWIVDGQRWPRQPHGPLLPGQQSQESSTRRQLMLAAGAHTIGFTADPAGALPDLSRANSTFDRQIIVSAREYLSIGDFRPIETLDPIAHERLGPADVLSLIFRGLVRFDPERRELVPELAETWEIDGLMEDRLRRGTKISIVFRLRRDVYFHDGAPLTAQDVLFTYRYASEVPHSAWRKQMKAIESIDLIDDLTIAFVLRSGATRTTIQQLFTLGVLPQHAIDLEPGRFGRSPIGTGPFQVAEFAPGAPIDLRAFEDYVQGRPRIDRMKIEVIDAERLFLRVLAGEVMAAVLPDLEDVRRKLQESGAWDLFRVAADQQALLHVQSRGLLERQPNPYDTNWNAHLWYLKQ